MKTIIVGDIHGHVDSVEAALAVPCNVVFVGDYLDSFGQTVDNQIRCLKMVLDAIEAEPDRVVGLFGNHERSYLDPHMRCSGYKMETHQHVKHLESRMRELLRTHYWLDDWLITHAGVDQELLDELGMTVQEYLDAGEFDQIGTYRGGLAHAGGLYWNDFNAEMRVPPGLKQVVGHTYSNRLHLIDGVRTKYGSNREDRSVGIGVVYCVDNLGRVPEVLMIDDDQAYPFNLFENTGADSFEPEGPDEGDRYSIY